jgi:hypothetical protein
MPISDFYMKFRVFYKKQIPRLHPIKIHLYFVVW